MGNAIKVLKFLNKNITSAGTREQLTTATDKQAREFTIQGLHSNTGSVWLGDDTVSSTVHAIGLDPGEKHTFKAGDFGSNSVFNLSDFYVDVETNGNDVAVSWT